MRMSSANIFFNEVRVIVVLVIIILCCQSLLFLFFLLRLLKLARMQIRYIKNTPTFSILLSQSILEPLDRAVGAVIGYKCARLSLFLYLLRRFLLHTYLLLNNRLAQLVILLVLIHDIALKI